jgi:hypothetical protein
MRRLILPSTPAKTRRFRVTSSGRQLPETGVATISSRAAEQAQDRAQRWLKTWADPADLTRVATWLDWQFWCWGRDIMLVPGNGLLACGFEQCRPPEGIRVSTCYRRLEHLADGTPRWIALWGYGLYFSEGAGEGLLLRRQRFAPCLTAGDGHPGLQWSIERSLPCRSPQTSEEAARLRRLIPALLGWIADYETGALENWGPAHREQCAATRARGVSVDFHAAPAHWRELAAALAERDIIATNA